MTQPRYELERIGLFSAVKTLFLLGGVGGFLLGIVQWLALWAMYGIMHNLSQAGGIPEAFELEMLLENIGGAGGIFFPLSGGFVGSIVGVIAAVLLGGLYNIAARVWGGLEFEWNEVKQSTAAIAPIQTPARPGEATPLPTTSATTVPPMTTETTQPEQPDDTPRDDDDDDGYPPRRPSSSMYE